MAAKTFVYVGNADTQDVTILELHDDGALREVTTVKVPGPDTPGGSLPLAVSPDKRHLYVALRSEPYSVASFAIDRASGGLTYLGSGSLAQSMCSIAIDATGRFLLSASYGGNMVAVNPVGVDGIVGNVQQTIITEPCAHCIIVDPTNRYVLHTSLGGEVVYQQKFDAAIGQLMPNTPPAVQVAVAKGAAKAGPRHLTFSPNGRFVYLVNELDGAIHVYPWDAETGTMKEAVQVASALPDGFTGTPWGADIHITPNGKFLYASERTTSTLAAFRIDNETGTLTPIASYPTETQPRGFNIDPSSRFVLSVGQLSNSLTVHAIDQTSGALNALKRYATGKNPNWIEIVTLP